MEAEEAAMETKKKKRKKEKEEVMEQMHSFFQKTEDLSSYSLT